jgi:hypothetical protein
MIYSTTVIKQLSLLLSDIGSMMKSAETDAKTLGTGDLPVSHGVMKYSYPY